MTRTLLLCFGKPSHLWLLVKKEVDSLLRPIHSIIETHIECSLAIQLKALVLNNGHLHHYCLLIYIEYILSEVNSVSRGVQN